MATDLWLALLACAFLLLSLAAQVLALLKGPGMRAPTVLVVVARAGATLLLIATLVTSGIAAGEWQPLDGALAAVGLVLAMLVIDLLLAWRTGTDGSGPVLDLISIALILLGGFALLPAAAPLSCAQRALPSRIAWLLLLLGAGATLVASSSGLMLGLCTLLGRLSGVEGAPVRNEVYCFLKRITMLSLVLLGAGLAAGIWWQWRTGIPLTGGDPRMGWMAVTWLITGTGLMAWQLGRRAARWAAVLTLLSGAVALFGLFVAPELVRAVWA